MATTIDLANLTLSHLGKDPIVTLTENSAEARAINRLLSSRVELALSRSHWTFARKIEALAALTSDWTQRWELKYQRPADALRIVRLIPVVDVEGAEPLPFEIMGDGIYTNEPDAFLEFVSRGATDPGTWPPMFFEAVSYLLARDIAMPLTRKKDIYGEMAQSYTATMSEAIAVDASQSPKFWTDDPRGYISARDGVATTTPPRNSDGAASYWG